jgi:hypothetical protein
MAQLLLLLLLALAAGPGINANCIEVDPAAGALPP